MRVHTHTHTHTHTREREREREREKLMQKTSVVFLTAQVKIKFHEITIAVNEGNSGPNLFLSKPFDPSENKTKQEATEPAISIAVYF